MIFDAFGAVSSLMSSSSSLFMSLRKRIALGELINGLSFLLQDKRQKAASEFSNISFDLNDWNINYIMATCLTGACGGKDLTESKIVKYSKKAISLLEYLIKHIEDYKDEKEADQKKARKKKKVELLFWLGRAKKVQLFANQKRGTLTKDSAGCVLLHGRPVFFKKRKLIRNYQEYIETIFDNLDDGLKIAKDIGCKQWTEAIMSQKALLFAMNNNREEVWRIQEELCYDNDEEKAKKEGIIQVSDSAQYIYERVRDRYNPEMAPHLHCRMEE